MSTTGHLPVAPHAFIGILIAVLAIAGLIGIGLYILVAFAYFHMFKKANVPHRWLAFIPIGQMWPLMWTIKRSAWNLLWLLLPTAGATFLVVWIVRTHHPHFVATILIGYLGAIVPTLWYIRLFKTFRMSPWWLLVQIGTPIPYLNFFCSVTLIVLFCYIGFSKRPYDPSFDGHGPNDPDANVPV